MKKLLLTASVAALWVACFSTTAPQTFANCDGVCEVSIASNSPGWSAYVFIPLPWYTSNAWGSATSAVEKKWRIIWNNEFGFAASETEESITLDELQAE